MDKFLTAQWRNLILINYEIDSSLIEDYLPSGTSFDLFDDRCFISLVAFQFIKTRVMGIPIPFHQNFEEVNLRFYVKRDLPDEVRRGVVFIKELVPKAAIAFVARTIYGEPYERWNMSSHLKEDELTYEWSKGRKRSRLHIEHGNELGVPRKDSLGEFIIEHYWGYTDRGDNRTDEYKVEHPPWSAREINYAEIDVEFGEIYGSRFEFLKETEPDSLIFTKGSEVDVYKGEKLRIAI